VRLQVAPPDSPIDRRGQIVERILESDECARYFRRDKWINRGVAYLGALRACRSDADHDRLASVQPDVHAAYALHGSADKLTRREVDGRLLAGQSFAAVADMCGLTAAAVECYAALYFDVADKLKADTFILCSALGGDIWDGSLTEDDTDVFLRLVGYQDGPILLAQLLRYFRRSWSVPQRLDGATTEELEELVTMLQCRVFIALHVRPMSKCGPVYRLYDLVVELLAYVDSLRGVVRRRDPHDERMLAFAKAVCAAHAQAAKSAATLPSTAARPQNPEAVGTPAGGEGLAVLPISADGGASFLSALRSAALAA
jgi:hypothetical protein